MDKWKTIEVILLAASALIAAAKGIIKFVGYISKLAKSKPRPCICR